VGPAAMQGVAEVGAAAMVTLAVVEAMEATGEQVADGRIARHSRYSRGRIRSQHKSILARRRHRSCHQGTCRCFGRYWAGPAVRKEDMAVVVRLAGSTGVLHSRCSRGRTCSRRKWILVRHHRRCHPQDTRTCFGRLRAGHEMGWAARAASGQHSSHPGFVIPLSDVHWTIPPGTCTPCGPLVPQ